MHNLIVILGPTASGKSALGVALAKKYGGIVISADSRQVYRGMDIGTGKITKKEMCGVPHYLLNVASPRSQFSVSKYVGAVSKIIKKTPSATPIFLVGGSPFYIDALMNPLLISSVPPNPALRRRLAKQTTAQLIARLRQLNPDRLKNIDVANRRRLIRAIEIANSNIHPGSILKNTLPSMRIIKIGIHLEKVMLHRNIDRRVVQRMKKGMLQEVRQLKKLGLSWKKLDAFGLEYRFLSRYLRGQLTKVEAVEQLKSATHEFAKRQMTWWKRDHEISWITKQSQASRLVKKFLSLWSRKLPQQKY